MELVPSVVTIVRLEAGLNRPANFPLKSFGIEKGWGLQVLSIGVAMKSILIDVRALRIKKLEMWFCLNRQFFRATGWYLIQQSRLRPGRM